MSARQDGGGGVLQRTTRLAAGLVTLGTTIVAGRTVASLAPWNAASIGLFLGLTTYAALGLTPRAGIVRRLRGRRLQVYFVVLGATMGLLGVVLTVLPGVQAQNTISIVLLVCAAIYIVAALIGFGRPPQPIPRDELYDAVRVGQAWEWRRASAWRRRSACAGLP